MAARHTQDEDGAGDGARDRLGALVVHLDHVRRGLGGDGRRDRLSVDENVDRDTVAEVEFARDVLKLCTSKRSKPNHVKHRDERENDVDDGQTDGERAHVVEHEHAFSLICA